MEAHCAAIGDVRSERDILIGLLGEAAEANLIADDRQDNNHHLVEELMRQVLGNLDKNNRQMRVDPSRWNKILHNVRSEIQSFVAGLYKNGGVINLPSFHHHMQDIFHHELEEHASSHFGAKTAGELADGHGKHCDYPHAH